MRFLFILIAVVALGIMTGCAGPRKIIHENPERQAALDEAIQRCDYEVEMSPITASYATRGTMFETWNVEQQKEKRWCMCMLNRGFTVGKCGNMKQ